MASKIRSRVTYANVMATLALFLALTGGAYAVAKLPKNSVGSKQLRRSAVTNVKVRKGTLGVDRFSTRAITSLSGKQGQKGDQGPAGAIGPSDAFSIAIDAEANIDASYATVLSLQLPSGSFTIHSSANLDNDEDVATAQVACRMVGPTGATLTGSERYVGLGDGGPGTFNDLAIYADDATVQLGGTGSIAMQCRRVVGSNQQVLGRSIVATKVGSLTSQ